MEERNIMIFLLICYALTFIAGIVVGMCIARWL